MGAIDFISVNRGTDVVIVSFHGAVRRESGPHSPRYGYKGELWRRSESFICVSDPTLELNHVVSLGWYVGTETWNVHSEVAELVQREATKMGARHIVLVGSSGGAFAAMAVGAKIPGSSVVAFSPSLAIDRVSMDHTENFLAAAFPEYSCYAELHATHPGRVSMEHVYASHPEVDLFLVQNAGDLSRIEHSYAPFAAQHSGHSCYTLTQEYHGDGHVGPPPERFHSWVNAAVRTRDIQLAS